MDLKRLKRIIFIYNFNKIREINCILAVYFNKILVTGTEEEITWTTKFMKEKFQITDVGEANFNIGVKFEKSKDGYLKNE